MRPWMALAALLAACGGSGSGQQNVDAMPDAPAVNRTFGGFIKVTFTAASDLPTVALSWTTDADIDTDATSGPLCNQHRNEQSAAYCVIAATSLSLADGITLRAHGSKPLVLLTTSGSFDLRGTIDVSSKRGGTPGAGANPMPMCSNGVIEASLHSGGYGGSFGGKGGNGGTPVATTGENGGFASSALATLPGTLRGGCPGGNGKMGIVDGGKGGAGGGAVAIIAPTINVGPMAKINASGAGGSGGPADPSVASGGGGGGSGGMIVLDGDVVAPSPATGVWIYAAGGGGGQGGTATGAGIGAGASGGESIDPAIAAAGGNTNTSGGKGGSGSFSGKNDGAVSQPAVNSGGGGAGGGGAGFIRAPMITDAAIAPEPR